MKTLKIEATTAAEASAIYCKLRDDSGEGASTFPDGKWNGNRISYNGRVWNADEKAIYPPKEESHDVWQGSCA